MLSLIAAVYPASGLNAGADPDLAAVDKINLLLRISGENRRLQS